MSCRECGCEGGLSNLFIMTRTKTGDGYFSGSTCQALANKGFFSACVPIPEIQPVRLRISYIVREEQC